MNFNKNASTYAHTQTSLLIGRPEHSNGAAQTIGQNASSHETGRTVAILVKTVMKTVVTREMTKTFVFCYNVLYISYLAELSLVVLYLFH